MQLAVNHLAYFLLTNLLLDPLAAGAPARVVSVSSGAHQGGRIDFADLQSERRYDPVRVYGRTKLANVLFTYELARRTRTLGVTANCLHPGVIATQLLADYMNVPGSAVPSGRLWGTVPDQGSETIVYPRRFAGGDRRDGTVLRGPARGPLVAGILRRGAAAAAVGGERPAGLARRRDRTLTTRPRAANLRHAHLYLSLRRVRHRVRPAGPLGHAG